MNRPQPDGDSEAVQRLLASPSYVKAYEDVAFFKRDELRPVRLQVELLKAELIQQEQNVLSTIVVFGSARCPSPEVASEELRQARQGVADAPDDDGARRALRRAETRMRHSEWYEHAREFSRIVSSRCQDDGRREFVIVTGGGPGIMEAANRGAHDVGAKSIGLNITLPLEQRPNPYITPELCFNFHYFAIRKMHFLMRARALVAFPGGFGTLDELFETLTLIQTRKVRQVPIVLFGRSFWDRVVDFPALVDEGVISPEDLDLFGYAETAEQAWGLISRFHD